MLAAFDDQIRRKPQPGQGARVERDGQIVRICARGDGWSGVTWSGLTDTDADAAIAAQIDRFAELAQPWEWKHYSFDQPADLPDRLRAAGLAAGPVEALLVAKIADLELDVPPPEGVHLVRVVDEGGVDALVRVHDAVFGGDHAALGREVLAGLAQQPAVTVAVVAMAGGTAVAGGRVEFSGSTDFASLWGGGTLRAWRGRGVFRSLVAHRAALARDAGFRYLQVDASAASRPILQRLGFVELAATTPYTHPGAPA